MQNAVRSDMQANQEQSPENSTKGVAGDTAYDYRLYLFLVSGASVICLLLSQKMYRTNKHRLLGIAPHNTHELWCKNLPIYSFQDYTLLTESPVLSRYFSDSP